MTAFHELPASWHYMLTLWSLLLCVTGIAGVILALTVKRIRNAILSFIAVIPSYLLWQATHDLHPSGISAEAHIISISLGRIYWIFWVIVLAASTFAAVLSLRLTYRHVRTDITPLAIKYCSDKMACGICYWKSSGRIIFSNDCMNRLCISLTGKVLMNGNVFLGAVPEGIHAEGSDVWSFAHREVRLGRETVHEMIASNVTETYTKTESLRRDNEELRGLSSELKAYSLQIDDMVRRQEILQAKVNIHDEMNRLMLSTVAAGSSNADLNHILSQWKKNALLLCLEADREKEESDAARLEKLAQALGIRLTWRGKVPEGLEGCRKELLFMAAREALVNAAKHAGAKNMEISFEETEQEISCSFENDGRGACGDVSFTGGLANLSVLAAGQGASLAAQAGERFRLIVSFSK